MPGSQHLRVAARPRLAHGRAMARPAHRPMAPAARALPHIRADSKAHSHAHLRPVHAAFGSGFRTGALLTIALLSAALAYGTDTRASVHSWLVSPVLRLVYDDAEEGHAAGIAALKELHALGLHPRERSTPDADGSLQVRVLGHTLSNPIAISAGLDKNAEAVSPLFALGPAIVEVGGITPRPQEGNAKPRVWRIPSQLAIVNRYGLNSHGAGQVAQNLRDRVAAFAKTLGYNGDAGVEHVLHGTSEVPPGSLLPGKLLAVQIAKNKATPDSDQQAVKRDYVEGVKELGQYADIIVVNVSSPNTPGLRDLQKLEPLQDILSAVVRQSRKTGRPTKPAVMVKVSPDENSDEDIRGICQAVWISGVDGVIVANTTKQRPNPASALGSLSEAEALNLYEQGGYSGPALLDNTVKLVAKYKQTLDLPLGGNSKLKPKVIFASGGISTGGDALRVLEAGASVAMVYTALSYKGSGFITELKQQLRRGLAGKTLEAHLESRPSL